MKNRTKKLFKITGITLGALIVFLSAVIAFSINFIFTPEKLTPIVLNVAMFLIDKDLIIDYNYFLIPQILCIIYLIILLLYESPSMPSNLPVTLYIIDTISLNLTLHAPNRHFLSNIYRD